VIEEPGLASEMGAKAQAHASLAYAEKRTIEEHLELYRELARA